MNYLDTSVDATDLESYIDFLCEVLYYSLSERLGNKIPSSRLNNDLIDIYGESQGYYELEDLILEISILLFAMDKNIEVDIPEYYKTVSLPNSIVSSIVLEDESLEDEFMYVISFYMLEAEEIALKKWKDKGYNFLIVNKDKEVVSEVNSLIKEGVW